MEKDVEVLTFNDEQMHALTRGLTAVAEEAKNAPKSSNEPLRAGDVIDLLSDTDNEEGDSSCEIFGMMYKDTELVQDIAQMVPFKMKEEIREELRSREEVSRSVDLQRSDARIDDDTDNSDNGEQYRMLRSLLQPKAVVISNEEIVSKYKHPPALKNVIINVSEMHKDDAMSPVPNSLPSIENNFQHDAVRPGCVSPTLNYTPPATNVETMLTFNGQDYLNTLTTLTDLAQDNVHMKEVNLNHLPVTQDIKTASGFSGVEVYNQGYDSNSAATFHTDQFECNNPYKEVTSMHDIIELEDSSCDEDMDEETEMKLIDLIESDSDQHEDGSIPSTLSSSAKPDTYEVLINYICPECGLSCGSLKKWKAHTDTVHDFRSIIKLNLHTIINKEGVLCYQCKDCFKKFNFNVCFSTVLRHRITHMPFSDYLKCRLCESRFKVRLSLRNHLKREHFKICKHYLGQRPTYQRHIKYHCPVCNKVQATQNNWRKHLEDEHDYNNMLLHTIAKINDNTVQCKECNSKFRQRHVRSHSLCHARYMAFHCKICTDFKTSTIVGCAWHIRKVHLNECRSFQCQYCDKHFKTGVTRNQHLREKHAYKFLKCDVCDKEFSASATLLSHMKLSNHQKLK